MNFSKVKLVVCIGLLLVNIVFAFMTVRLVGNKNYISEDEVVLAQKHLAKNGITFSFDKQARRLYDIPIYSIEKSASDGIPAIYKRMTEVFFDEPTEESDYIKTPTDIPSVLKTKREFLSEHPHFSAVTASSATERTRSAQGKSAKYQCFPACLLCQRKRASAQTLP